MNSSNIAYVLGDFRSERIDPGLPKFRGLLLFPNDKAKKRHRGGYQSRHDCAGRNQWQRHTGTCS